MSVVFLSLSLSCKISLSAHSPWNTTEHRWNQLNVAWSLVYKNILMVSVICILANLKTHTHYLEVRYLQCKMKCQEQDWFIITTFFSHIKNITTLLWSLGFHICILDIMCKVCGQHQQVGCQLIKSRLIHETITNTNIKTNKGPPKTNNGYFNLANPWIFILQRKLNPVINIRVLHFSAALTDMSDRKLDIHHLPHLTYIYYEKYLSLADLKTQS